MKKSNFLLTGTGSWCSDTPTQPNHPGLGLAECDAGQTYTHAASQSISENPLPDRSCKYDTPMNAWLRQSKEHGPWTAMDCTVSKATKNEMSDKAASPPGCDPASNISTTGAVRSGSLAEVEHVEERDGRKASQ